MIAFPVLVIIGALNWLLVGLFQFDLVASVVWRTDALLSRIIYTIVGIAGAIVSAFFSAKEKPRQKCSIDKKQGLQ